MPTPPPPPPPPLQSSLPLLTQLPQLPHCPLQPSLPMLQWNSHPLPLLLLSPPRSSRMSVQPWRTRLQPLSPRIYNPQTPSDVATRLPCSSAFIAMC